MTTMGDLYAERKRQGLTQAYVAAHLGVSQACVSMWETGRVQEVAVDDVAAYAELLGVEMTLDGLEQPGRWVSDRRRNRRPQGTCSVCEMPVPVMKSGKPCLHPVRRVRTGEDGKPEEYLSGEACPGVLYPAEPLEGGGS